MLQLAPGGHVGRFCIWTEAAFDALDGIFGTQDAPSTSKLHNGNPARLPSGMMTNSDLSRLINSDEVQSKVQAPKAGHSGSVLKCNPLKNKAAMDALNPAAPTIRKRAQDAQKKPKAKRAKRDKAVKALQKKYYRSMIAEE